METKNAIGLLNHHIETWKGKFPPAHFEACKIAIQALEKQVPMKLECRGQRQIGELFYYTCPACGRIYWRKETADNYCGSCGQKLNWG